MMSVVRSTRVVSNLKIGNWELGKKEYHSFVVKAVHGESCSKNSANLCAHLCGTLR
jgi:hypothetical protein